MLGEIPLPSAPRSVFDYMSQKDRERLQNIASSGTSATPSGSSTTKTGPLPSAAPATITIPHTEPHIASAALRGFQPFVSDPAKQARYTAYLNSQASPGTDTSDILKPLPGQKIDEFNKEHEDYAKAALIFKPISGAMAGRFTSAAVVDHAQTSHEGLHTPSADKPAAEKAQKAPEEEEISPKAHAAKMGMYGPLTREVKPWSPAPLLCKRFGVKDPNPKPETTDKKGPTAATPAANVDPSSLPSEFTSQEAPTSFASTSSGAGSCRTRAPLDLNNIGLGEDETPLTYERPAMDIFKAIFASDDEDSDDGGDAQDVEMDKEDKEPAPSIPPPVAQEPRPPEAPVADSGPFKLTFIPRDKDKEKDKSKEKEKKKKKRDKEKKGVLVSFALEEDGGEEAPSKDPPRKKKRKKEKREEEDNDEMWVEKPAPEIVKDIEMQPPPSEPPEGGTNPTVASPARGRKRAVDFM